ncbi:MAG: hypothetical protein NTU53_02225 [Planctomycetota bacterium]|nr:hypothetical protein [Planctomycetota bacterium]
MLWFYTSIFLLLIGALVLTSVSRTSQSNRLALPGLRCFALALLTSSIGYVLAKLTTHSIHSIGALLFFLAFPMSLFGSLLAVAGVLGWYPAPPRSWLSLLLNVAAFSALILTWILAPFPLELGG